MSNIDNNSCKICCSSANQLSVIEQHSFTFIDGKKYYLFDIIQTVLNKDLKNEEFWKICDSCINSLKLFYKVRDRSAQNAQDEIKDKIYHMFETYWNKHKTGYMLVTETNNQLIVEDIKLYYCRQCLKPFKTKDLRKDHEDSGCRINSEKIPKLAYNCLKTYFDGSEDEDNDNEDDDEMQDRVTPFEIQNSVPSSSGFSVKKEDTETSPDVTQSFQNQSMIPEELKEEELNICDVMIDEAEEVSLGSFSEPYGDHMDSKYSQNPIDDAGFIRFVAQFKCPVCNGEYKSLFELTQHARSSHSPIILCDTDFKQYENQFQIDGVNTTVYTCKECNYSSKIKANFKRHLLLMAQKKSKVSNFKHRQSEDSDISIVTKDKGDGREQRVFQCKHCNYGSEFRANVMRHLKARHTPSADGIKTPLVRMKCIDCDFETRHLNNMRHHREAVHGPMNTQMMN